MTSHLGIYTPGLTMQFYTKTLTLECPEGAEIEMIQSDDYDDVLIFFFSTPRLDVGHVASSPELPPILKSETGKLYSAGFLGRAGPNLLS